MLRKAIRSFDIRNFEDLDTLARAHGMHLQADFEMPVNNRLLVWVKPQDTQEAL